MMKRIILVAVILLSLAGEKLFSQVPDFCLTKDEYRLYSLINTYRTKNGLNVIPISRSLCYVAKVHAHDLSINNPDTSLCSLNSWSDKGLWTACCHSNSSPNPACIVNKPKELAKYNGEGHELAYWDSEALVPDTIIRFWQSIEQAKDLLLNQKKWSYFKWKAIGIGLYNGYACVWVGEVTDTLPEPVLCAGNNSNDSIVLPLREEEKDVVTKPTGRYYIIFGSFNTREDAAKMVEKYRKQGFNRARIVVNDQKTYRVSLNDFPAQQQALEARKKLGIEFKEAWITKY
jgi:hypothetical protein